MVRERVLLGAEHRNWYDVSDGSRPRWVTKTVDSTSPVRSKCGEIKLGNPKHSTRVPV